MDSSLTAEVLKPDGVKHHVLLIYKRPFQMPFLAKNLIR